MGQPPGLSILEFRSAKIGLKPHKVVMFSRQPLSFTPRAKSKGSDRAGSQKHVRLLLKQSLGCHRQQRKRREKKAVLGHVALQSAWLHKPYALTVRVLDGDTVKGGYSTPRRCLQAESKPRAVQQGLQAKASGLKRCQSFSMQGKIPHQYGIILPKRLTQGLEGKKVKQRTVVLRENEDRKLATQRSPGRRYGLAQKEQPENVVASGYPKAPGCIRLGGGPHATPPQGASQAAIQVDSREQGTKQTGAV